MKTFKAIFAGGGTGGHLFPALTIASALKERLEPEYKTEFRFVGTKRGLEYRMKETLGYPLIILSVRGFMRSAILSNIVFPFVLFWAYVRSIFILRRFDPDIVIGTGGYVMGPVLMAAITLNMTRVIQEQNSYPGVTTRTLAKKVFKVFLGFADAKKYLPECDTMVTGNPIRRSIGRADRKEAMAYFGLDENKKTVLVLGGSQGALSINQNVLRHLDDLGDGIQLVWQTGERAYTEVTARAGGRVSGRALFAFTDKIELAYAAADLVIARSGALTLAEIEAAGLPAILIPFPYATADHQRKNAQSFVAAGAAVLVDDEQLGEVSLPAMARGILDSDKLEAMKNCVRKMRQERSKPAADVIVDYILQLTGVIKETA